MTGRSRSGPAGLPRGLSILFEDGSLLVVAKPAGLLTVGNESERDRTAHRILVEYVRRGSPRARNSVFVVHRLDQWTSGVLLFAKTEAAQQALKNRWEDTAKQYLAVVHGRVAAETDTISSYLAENRAYAVYATSDPARGRLSRTTYRVLRRTAKFTLLEIDLLTGRKHQIRVHLAGIGHPVVGDRRYGPEDAAHRDMALHARCIAFTHPVTGERLRFETAPPRVFSRLVGPIPDPIAPVR